MLTTALAKFGINSHTSRLENYNKFVKRLNKDIVADKNDMAFLKKVISNLRYIN